MSRSRWAALSSACLLYLGCRSGGPIRHVGLTAADRALLCARASFHRPVVTGPLGPWLLPAGSPSPSAAVEHVPCSASADEVRKALREQGVGVLEGRDVVYLVDPTETDSHRAGGPDGRTDLALKTEVRGFSQAIAGSRQLAEKDLAAIAGECLRDARPAPLRLPAREGSAGAVEVGQLLVLDAHRLSRSSESVIGLLGEALGEKRLIYGEIHGGRYRALWDAPILQGGILGLSYEDVDGDGSLEMCFTGDLAGQRSYRTLAIFDRSGNELTRQESCALAMGGYSTTCPIVGSAWRFEAAPGGKRDILVEREGGTDRYRLAEGRYVLVR